MAFAIDIGLGGWIVAIISIVFGILVMMFPKFLRFVIGIYFILIGVLTIIALLL
ncbi:MAG: DUF3096 domain-containing protein [archaeon]